MKDKRKVDCQIAAVLLCLLALVVISNISINV